MCIPILWFEYSVELRVEYSNTRPIPEVAINYKVAQNKRTPGSLFKFVMQRFEMSRNDAGNVSARLQLENFHQELNLENK